MIDFSKYKFRASQMHFLMVGNIGLSEKQEEELQALLNRENDPKAKPLTNNMKEKVKELLEKKAKNELPLTMKKELRKIHRAERYNRNFIFTNKYVQKGIIQEDDAILLYQEYRNSVLGINTHFLKNDQRLENDWFSGEPDLRPQDGIGFDTKCSWSLESFPYKEDKLDGNYEYQNQVYMDLEGVDKWITVYVLINGLGTHLYNEKLKHYYAMGQPEQNEHDEEEIENYNKYVEVCRDLEKMMIYDYDEFVSNSENPPLEISKEEWFGEGYDIPLEERVIEKVSERNEETLTEMKKRIVIARKYLTELEASFKPNKL